MKKIWNILLAIIVTFSMTVVAYASTGTNVSEQTQVTDISSGKTLVVFFSHTGNTQALAEIIQDQTGGDLVEIIRETPYSTNDSAFRMVAETEIKEQARPKLSTVIQNMDSYSTVYIGYPIWWNTFPMPVATFLESYDFSEKVVIPFATHAGSEMGNSEADISALIPDATLLKGLAVSGNSVSLSQSRVSSWVQVTPTAQISKETEIIITDGDKKISAVLNDTQTARDIIQRLPLTINAKDWKDKAFYGSIEVDIVLF